MIKNLTGKTELLRSLSIGETSVWHYDPSLTTADKQQKLFTASLTRLPGVKIKQSTGLIVIPGVIPYHVITIERIA